MTQAARYASRRVPVVACPPLLARAGKLPMAPDTSGGLSSTAGKGRQVGHGTLRQCRGRKRIRLGYACLLGLWACAALCGCGQDGRQALEGTVTVDGKPLGEGDIVFFPQPGTLGPTAGGQIVQGHFSVAPEGGTLAGTFRVEITATRKTGEQVKDPTLDNALVDRYEQYLPTRYNQQSELTAEVTETGPNRFEFPLSSQ